MTNCYLIRPLGLFLIVLLVLAASVGANDTGFQPNYNPTLETSPMQGEIRIDGDMSDSGWRNAARATGFVETNPGDQVEPEVRTEAMITYDQSNLYVALIAWDDPSQIRVSMSDRDRIFRDDYIGILFDTYGDYSWGYEIFVNPIGIQGDLRILSGGGEDMSLDLVFESRGIVTDSGYQVELAIPFASLRFPNQEEQTWRLNFWRDRQRENRYRYSWRAQDRDNGCFICQFGTVTGIKGIKPGQNIDILPNLIAFQSGSLEDPGVPVSGFRGEDPEAELSITGRYGLSSNASLELTVNPDFSQVESDAGQVDVNRTFALYYNERRPFFQEGSNLYASWVDMIHTRTINDPSLATKFTGQFGRFSLVYLLARDDHTPLILPFAEQSSTIGLLESYSNVLRGKRMLFQESHVGFTITDRRISDHHSDTLDFTSGSGTSFGIDSRLKLHSNLQIELQGVTSRTEEIDLDDPDADDDEPEYFDNGRYTKALDGESFSGQAFYASLERTGRTWFFDFDYYEYSPTFRSDNGFVTQNDYRTMSIYTNLTFQPNREWLVEWSPSFSIGRKFAWHGAIDMNLGTFGPSVEDEWLDVSVYAETKGQTAIDLGYLQSRERYHEQVFPGISRGHIYLRTRPSGKLETGFDVTFGRSIYRYGDEMANMFDFTSWVDLKLSSRLSTESSWIFARMDRFDRNVDLSEGKGSEIYKGHIFRTRLDYQFTREWFLRLVVEYNDFSSRLAVEPLLTYKINPFTVFYLGMSTNSYHYDKGYDYDLDGQERYLDDPLWKLSSTQVFAKFQYLIRM